MSSNCLFCKIAKGQIPSKKVYEDDEIYAFHDINPLRSVHILVIPKRHITSLSHTTEEDIPVLGKMLHIANKLAKTEGSAEGFRLIINTDRIGGQEVPHLHVHIIGGTEPVGAMLKKI